MSDNEMFKTTLMGGYDKEDVHEQFNALKDSQASIQTQFKKDLAEKDADIAKLEKQLEDKEQEKYKLEREISEKYQKYVDHHNSISNLLVDAQIKADEIISEAKRKTDRMIYVAEEEIRRKYDDAQIVVDERINTGERKYQAIQDEMDEIMELINQAQKRFMASYKEIHKIISDIPKRETEGEDDGDGVDDEA